MTFYDLYENIKLKNNNSILIIRNGTFYIAIGNDAKCLSYYTGLKLTKYNNKLFKVGFPVGYLEKYLDILKKNYISYSLYDDNGEFLNNELFNYNDKFYGLVSCYIGDVIDTNLYNNFNSDLDNLFLEFYNNLISLIKRYYE